MPRVGITTAEGGGHLHPIDPQLAPPAVSQVALELAGPDLVAEWEELARSVGARAWARPGWIVPWAEAFGAGPLRCLTARSGDQLVGLLPLVGRPGRRLRSATNTETPAYGPVTAGPGILARMLAGRPEECRRLSLSFVPRSGYDLVPPGPYRGGTGLRSLERVMRRSPYVSTTGDFAEYERTRLTPGRRKNLRRYERRLAEMGRVEFQVCDGSEGLDDLLREGFELEAAGWKGANGTAILSRPAAHRFYRAALRWAAAEGLLRLWFLRVDGRPLAFAMSLREASVVTGLKVAYDEEFRHVAPGLVLLVRRLEHCFGDPGVDRLDFMGESEGYKLEFAHGSEAQMQVELFAGRRATAERWALQGAWRARDEARRRVPVELRERVDLSSPQAALGSVAKLAVDAGARRLRHH